MAQTLTVNIVGDASKLSQTVDEAGKSFTGSVKEWAKGALVLGGVSEGFSTVVDIAKDAISAATQEQAAQAKLNAIFAAAHIPISEYKDTIDKAEASGRALGFTNVDTENSLGGFVAATKNVTESIKLMNVAEDLARFKHESLQTASKVLTSTMSGNTRAARELGIQFVASTTNVDALKEKYKLLNEQVPKAALMAAQLRDKQQNARDVIDKVSAAVKGQAAAFAGTAAGAADRFHASLDNLEAILGQKILPIIATVTGAVASFIEGIQNGTGAGGRFADGMKQAFDVVKTVAGDLITAFKAVWDAINALGPLKDIILGIAAAVAIWKGAQLLLDLALDANPVGLLITAVAALAVGIVELVKHFNDVIGIAKDAWDAISAPIGDVVNAVWTDGLKPVFDSITGAITGVAGTISGIVTGVGSAIDRVANAIWKDGIKPAFDSVTDAITRVADTISGIVKAVGKAVGKVADAIWKDGFKDPFDSITGAITGIADTFSGIVKAVGKAVSGVASAIWDKGIKSAFDSISSGIASIPGDLLGIVKAILNAAKSVGAEIIKGISAGLGAAGDLFSPIAGAFKSVINTIIGWWDSLHFSIPKVDIGPIHIGGGEIGLPHIPYLAAGVTNFIGGLAVVGEQGPELVHLPGGSSVIPAGRTAAMLGGGASGAGVHYHFEIGQVVANDPQTLVNQLRVWVRSNGSLAAAGVS